MRARLRAGGIGILLVSTRLLACSSSSSSPASDAGSADGGPLADGAPGGDAGGGTDGSLVDGAVPQGCDAYDAGWFCTDFDRSDDLAAGWTGTHSEGEGGLDIDSLHFVSPSHSLHAILVNDVPGTINYRQRAVKNIGSGLPRYELAFAVLMAQATDATGAVAIGELSFEQNSAGDQYVFIGAGASGLVLGNDWYPTSGPPTITSTPLAPLPTSKFVHVDLVVDLAPAAAGLMNGTVTVSLDGAIVVDHVALESPIAETAKPSAGVGPSSTHVAITEGWMDNVVVYPQQ
jgi:hypothetical protein